MTKEKAITVINNHKEHWERLLREKICDETEGKETIESFAMALSALEKNESAEDWYKLFCEKWDEGELVCHVPKGMTNGELIQALFPNISVYEHGSTYSVNNEYNFNSTWWNAPYKAEEGGE